MTVSSVRRVLITGLGCVTPCGTGVRELWASVVAGRSGIGLLTAFDASGCGSRVAGEVKGFRPEDFLSTRDVKNFARYLHLGVAAARLAWDDAGAPSAIDADRVGVFLGTSLGASGRHLVDYSTFQSRGLKGLHPMTAAQHAGAVPSAIAIALGLHGPAYAVSTACTASADAAGLAFGQIAGGLLDAAVVAGAEAPLAPLLFAAFDRVGLLSRLDDPPERASRPFSRDRDGLVLSEGASALLLEAEGVARERGAPVYAELAGYGATCDAYHHIHTDPSGVQAARAVSLGLACAGLAAEDVDYVNAHGTATVQNDITETAILKKVFGERVYAVPVSSSKSMLGHLLGAAGATELLISALAVHQGVVPPTINLVEPDPACDLDYVAEGARRARLRVVLSTSFGFGSRNAALIVSACSTERPRWTI